MSQERDRVISVSLTEAEWQAFIARQPQPVVWLRERIETNWHRWPLEPEEKRALLDRLVEVFQFERFIQKAYLGQKMFSIEGLDSVVPMIDEIAALSERNGANQVVLGMAHRGRLSVLAHNLDRVIPNTSWFVFLESRLAPAYAASASATRSRSSTTSPSIRTAASPSYGVGPFVTIATAPPRVSVRAGSEATG